MPVKLLSCSTKPSLLCSGRWGSANPISALPAGSLVGSPNKGAGGRQGWRRNNEVFLPVSQFASPQHFFTPAGAILSAAAEPNMQFFQHLENHQLPDGSSVSWAAFRDTSSQLKPPPQRSGPQVYGATLPQETSAQRAIPASQRSEFQQQFHHLPRSLALEVVRSFCSCCLWYSEFFLPFLILSLVNSSSHSSYPDLQ